MTRVEDKNLLLSHFSKETYAAFVEKPKPPQICCLLHEANPDAEVWNIDVARCRRNGLAENVIDLPVYSPMDEVVPSTFGELADYNWVEAGCRSPLLSLPYFGPGWYGKATCAYLLDHRIISLPDIKLAFNATTRVPAKRLHDWMETLEELWAEATEGFEFDSKLAINAMAGIWASIELHTYCLKVSSDPSDILFDGPLTVRDTPGGTGDEKDYISKVRQLKLTSMRPIHQICLEAERLNVARALYIIRKHCPPNPHNRVLAIQVDGIYFQPGKRAAPKIVDEIVKTVYGNLHRVIPREGAKQRPTSRPVATRAPRGAAESHAPEDHSGLTLSRNADDKGQTNHLCSVISKFPTPAQRRAEIESMRCGNVRDMLPSIQPSTTEYQRTGKAWAPIKELHQPTLTGRTDWQESIGVSDSGKRVYRIEKLAPKYYADNIRSYNGQHRLGGTLAFHEAERPLMPTLEWTTLLEEPGSDFFTHIVRPHVIGQRKSAMLTGPPGSGKSVVLRKLAEELRAQGETVKIISLTHVAARNVEGQTAHSFVHGFVQNGRYEGWLFIDEISMMTLPLLAHLETLRLGKVKILCFGDFDQLPSINNSWRGEAVDSRVFQHSRLMKTWCDCTILRLTQGRRCDTAHFDYYCKVPAMDLETAIVDARARHPAAPGTSADWNLTISHYRRMQLNEDLQEAATRAYKAGGGTAIVHIAPNEEGEEEMVLKKRRLCKNKAQAYDLWPGTRLIGSDNATTYIVNGALLDVLAVEGEEKNVKLRDIETKVEFSLTPEQVAKHTRLRWAVTYPAIQGRTLEGTVKLWDTTSRHFSIEALYVGLSRAKAGCNVSVV